MAYRLRTEGWSWWQHATLIALYTTGFIGFVSFLTFDIMFLTDMKSTWLSDDRIWSVILAVGFFTSLQLGWGVLIWKISCLEKPWKPAALAIVPLLFTSVPLGVGAFFELTREPPPPARLVY